MGYDDELIAGFHSATRAVLEEKRRAAELETDADRALKRERHRHGRTEASDPKSKAVIESNELKRYVDRLTALSREKAEVQDAIKAVYAQAKEAGYPIPSIRIVVKRALEEESDRLQREESEAVAQRMMIALGMLADTPLGAAALRAAE